MIFGLGGDSREASGMVIGPPWPAVTPGPMRATTTGSQWRFDEHGGRAPPRSLAASRAPAAVLPGFQQRVVVAAAVRAVDVGRLSHQSVRCRGERKVSRIVVPNRGGTQRDAVVPDQPAGAIPARPLRRRDRRRLVVLLRRPACREVRVPDKSPRCRAGAAAGRDRTVCAWPGQRWLCLGRQLRLRSVRRSVQEEVVGPRR